jgi:hypothetical protein
VFRVRFGELEYAKESAGVAGEEDVVEVVGEREGNGGGEEVVEEEEGHGILDLCRNMPVLYI